MLPRRLPPQSALAGLAVRPGEEASTFCWRGTDPAASVIDSAGRTHDHANLFVVGAPTLPTAGCTNGTVTVAGLTLRAADHIATALGGVRSEVRG